MWLSALIIVLEQHELDFLGTRGYQITPLINLKQNTYCLVIITHIHRAGLAANWKLIISLIFSPFYRKLQLFFMIQPQMASATSKLRCLPALAVRPSAAAPHMTTAHLKQIWSHVLPLRSQASLTQSTHPHLSGRSRGLAPPESPGLQLSAARNSQRSPLARSQRTYYASSVKLWRLWRQRMTTMMTSQRTAKI